MSIFLKSTIVMAVSISFFICINLVMKGKLYLIDTQNILSNSNYLSLSLLLNFLPYI